MARYSAPLSMGKQKDERIRPKLFIAEISTKSELRTKKIENIITPLI